MINNNVISFRVEEFKYLGTTLTNKNSIQKRGNLSERDRWGDPDIDGRVILGWIFRK